jgi:SNF2 family DNA or RNA helicase
MRFNWAIRSKEHEELIYEKVKDITFRLDGTDYLNLPPITYNTIKVKLPEALMLQYKKLEKDFFIHLEDSNVEAFSAASLSMKLRQFIQGAMYTDDKGSYVKVHTEKLDRLKEIVETANGQGILCPIQFKFELDLIRKVFPKVPAIVGGVPMTQATAYIRAWNAKELPLLLCHPASLSHAVNMQYGSYIVLWYALTWSSEQYLQLNKRVHRTGQTNPVVIHHLCADNTVDIAVMQALASKITNQQKFLDFIKLYHERM